MNHFLRLDKQKQIISVSFDYRVENIALSKIPNCKSVVNTSGFEYELTFNCSEDKRPMYLILLMKMV